MNATNIAAGGFAMPMLDTSNITRKWLDIDYTPDNPHPARKLDIYLPEEGDGPFPTIICIHGGAFTGGSKDDMQVAAYFDFIPLGYAVVSVEQRLCNMVPGIGYNPEGRFPNPVHDFRAAIRFCRANAEKYHFDPKRFITAGGSAGGYHSIMGAVQPDNPALYDESLGWNDVDGTVHAVVDWFGVGDMIIQSDFTDNTPMVMNGVEFKMDNYADTFIGFKAQENPTMARLASPETWITKDLPPVLLQHGIADQIVPIECSRSLKRRIDAVCGPDRAAFDEFEGYAHGDPGFNAEPNIERVAKWLESVLK